MRKLRIIPLIALIAALSGCRTHTELNEIAIAEAIGIDRAGDGYTVTLQYFNTDTTGGTTAIDSSQPNAVNVSGKGETIESALEALSYSSGKSVLLGSAGLIVFGRDAAYDLADSLSFAMAHYSGNPCAYIAVSETSASDILNVKFSEGNASVEKLECMLRNAEDLGMNCPPVLHEAAEQLTAPTGSTVLPLLKMSDNGSELSEEGGTVLLAGGAVCTEHSYAAELSPEDMSGLLLLTEEDCKCEMTVIYRGKNVRVMLYGTKARIMPSLTDGRLLFVITVSADCKIVSSQLSEPYSDREAIERLAGEEVCRRVNSVLAKTVTALGADTVGLSYKIRSHSPELWNTVSANYRQFLSEALFSVSSDLKMERFGVMHG